MSKTIKHLEDYNKMFNVEKYASIIDDCKLDNPDNNTLLMTILKATMGSSPYCQERIKNGYDYDKALQELLNDKTNQDELVKNYFVFMNIWYWLEYKQIYKFDLDTLETIVGSEYKDLTYEELKCLKMPYESFAIENELTLNGEVFDSILVSRKNCKSGNILISVYCFSKNRDNRICRFEVFAERQKTLMSNASAYNDSDISFVKKVMNLVLYICQPKVDVRIIRSTPKKKQIKKLKHFYNIDYEENEVGYRLGSAIRNYKYIYKRDESPLTPDSDKPRRKVKPHTRCGHYHHYWIGKGRTDLIVKYVEPTFVLGGNKVATIHQVKK